MMHGDCNNSGNRCMSARTRTSRGRRLVIASETRLGRIKRQVRRAFIASNGRPLTTGELLPICYPRLTRFQDWHRWSVRRALLPLAIKVGRRMGRGLPFLWAPKSAAMLPIRCQTE
jgi:hypothetical protein